MSASPVTLEDLPADLRSRYIAADGRARVEVFPSEDLASNPAMGRFVRAVQSVAPTAIGAPVEILEGGGAVVEASLVATAIAVAAGAVLLILTLGNLRDPILVLLPLVLTAILTGASSAPGSTGFFFFFAPGGSGGGNWGATVSILFSRI